MIQNRYLVVQAIGKGGMGEVYLAIDQRLGSAVALKRTFFSEDEALGNAFEREARILARLRHPVLPKVIDHFIENNDQFLVMEHISGDDLAKRLENANKPFPLSWVMFWADQMLDALNYLHSHEPPIVHRDIKPQNLKLTDDNHIVLLDFGLSKDFDTASKNSLNSASVAGYSPHFASMEQIRGTGTDARSDLYSLAATLYQLMANQAPSDALTRADALLAGRPDPIIPLDELNPEISPAISDVILRGVAIRQDERFATAVEMQKALRRAFNRGQAASAVETEELAARGRVNAEPVAADRVADAATVEAKRSSAARAPEPTLKFETPAGTSVVDEFAETEAYSLPQVDPRDLKVGSADAPEIAAAAVVASAGVGSVTAGGTQAVSASVIDRPQPVKKKASSKTGLIIGGLAGLFVIAALAAGGGWYAYSNYSSLAPTPSPAQPIPASPAPVVADVSTDANANVAVPSATAPAPESIANSQPAAPVTRSTPQVTAKAPTSRPSQPAASKPAAKAKTDDRTKIEQ